MSDDSTMAEKEPATVTNTTLFPEFTQVMLWIRTELVATESRQKRDDALSHIRTTFDKYLECPTLLDPHLGELVTHLAADAKDRLTRANQDQVLCYLLSALYAVAKVRGRKKIKLFLPHEVKDMEPVLFALKAMQDQEQQQDVPGSPPNWESVYILWLWLSHLSLVPFSTKSTMAPNLVPTILQLGRDSLEQAGPVRETAAACLASWLSRPELEETELPSFLTWSRDVLSNKETAASQNVFLTMGIVQTLASLLKVGQRTESMVKNMEAALWEIGIEKAETCRQIGLRKLWTKWLARMGCAYLPPRPAQSWRYQRGGRSLLTNLQKPIEEQSETQSQDDLPTENLFFVPDPVEDAMGQMIASLQDGSTVVRWCAAKGTGRIAERLPSLCIEDVVDAIVAMCTPTASDGSWHGACLALAELARRGLLMPSRLQEVVPILVQATDFDVPRKGGGASVGAHVRDAACYTLWAFARAYAARDLQPYAERLSQSMVLLSLFDREVNVRRAASAAFQEWVGRQPTEVVPHGIPILTTADYFSLGNRTDAYTTIAHHVGEYEEYTRPILKHLYESKLFHWDADIRLLSAKALRQHTSRDPHFVKEHVVKFLLLKSTSTTLETRHGAIHGLAGVVLALGKDEIRESEKPLLAELVAKIEKLRLYRGRGGEIVRGAVCRYIECLCSSRMTLTVKQQVRLLDSIDANLKHPSEDIQEKAAKALGELMTNYFPVGKDGQPSDRLQKRVVDKYVQLVVKSDYPAETRGFTLALGMLPRKLLAPSAGVLRRVVSCLAKVARPDTKVGKEKDAETRRNAVVAVAKVVETVGIAKREDDPTLAVVFGSEQAKPVFECLLLSLQDYNTDRRGDVGSWARIAAIQGLTNVLVLIGNKDNDVVNAEQCIQIFAGILKQFAEKLDCVRDQAARCMVLLVASTDLQKWLPEPCLSRILSTFQVDDEETNWSKPEVTFPKLVGLLGDDVFFSSIFEGLVTTVGGNSGSGAAASKALFDWIKSDERHVHRVGIEIIRLLQARSRNRRIIPPLLTSAHTLVSQRYLDPLSRSREGADFLAQLMVCLEKEAIGCTSVPTLLKVVSLSLDLVGYMEHLTESAVWRLVVSLLLHPYPRIRKQVADDLYVCLLEGESRQTTADFLLEVQWGDDGWSADDLNELGMTLATKLGVSNFVKIVFLKQRAESSSQNVASKRVDEFETYASLVNSTT